MVVACTGHNASNISQYYTGPVGVGHSGIDIYTAGIYGSDVVASKTGKVVKIVSGCNNYNGLGTGGIDCSTSIGCTATTTKHEYKNNAGEIISTRWFCNEGVGNMVILEHEITNKDKSISYLYSQYCHLLTIDVSMNQTIKQGIKIGTVGSTGESQAPHLHFSLSTGIEWWRRDRFPNNPGDVTYTYEVEQPVKTVTVTFYDDLLENG